MGVYTHAKGGITRGFRLSSIEIYDFHQATMVGTFIRMGVVGMSCHTRSSSFWVINV